MRRLLLADESDAILGAADGWIERDCEVDSLSVADGANPFDFLSSGSDGNDSRLRCSSNDVREFVAAEVGDTIAGIVRDLLDRDADSRECAEKTLAASLPTAIACHSSRGIAVGTTAGRIVYRSRFGNWMCLDAHRMTVTDVAIDAARGRLVSASWDQSATLWDLESGRVIARLRGHRRAVSSCQFVAASDLIATASWDGALRVWSACDGHHVATWQLSDDAVHAIRRAPERGIIIAGLETGEVVVFDVIAGATLARWQAHRYAILALDVRQREGVTTIFTAGLDRALCEWDLYGCERRRVTLASSACAIAVDDENDALHAVTQRGRHVVWRLDDGVVDIEGDADLATLASDPVAGVVAVGAGPMMLRLSSSRERARKSVPQAVPPGRFDTASRKGTLARSSVSSSAPVGSGDATTA